jgi:hypothetical protein
VNVDRDRAFVRNTSSRSDRRRDRVRAGRIGSRTAMSTPPQLPQLSPKGYVLPPHWTPLLARALRHENGTTFFEVGTLPASQAFGAPPRIELQIDHDETRNVLIVRALRLEGRIVPLDACRAPWLGFWLDSLPRALEAEIRRRRATIPMRLATRPAH